MKIFTLSALAATLLTCSAQAQGSLNTGLLGRFPFDNAPTDATGNMGVNSATNVAYGPDAGNRTNAALRLGANGEVWITPNGLLDFGITGDYSFSIGFKTISSATEAFFTNQGSSATAGNSNAQGWFLGFDNSRVGKVYFGLGGNAAQGNGIGLSTTTTYNDNAWHTAAVVVSRSTNRIQVFVDGVAQAIVNNSPNPNFGSVSGTVFTIGAQGMAISNASPGTSASTTGAQAVINRFGLGFNGSLDEGRFYNRALTATEVASLNSQVLATVAERRGETQLQLFPNPTAGGQGLTLRVAAPVAASSIGVFDALGRRTAVTVVAASPTEFAVAGLAPGVYSLRVTLPAGPAVRRLVVQ